MSKIAFVYPGQGAQRPGMGEDFYRSSTTAAELYDRAGEALGMDLKTLCFTENSLLNLTEYTQAALAVTCLAMTEAIKEMGIVPDMTAGLSLGEYCAISAAGGMSAVDAVKLVRKRGILMENAVPAGQGAMCAVLSLDDQIIEQVISDIADVSIANYNCPGQTVITGRKEAVEEAALKLSEAGARRTVMLNVSGPFHSPFLKTAGELLAAELDKVQLSPLKCPYVTNVTAELISDIARSKKLLEMQVSSPVKWTQSVRTMIDNGVDTFIEIGPGKTVSGFIKKIDRSVKVLNADTWDAAQLLRDKL